MFEEDDQHWGTTKIVHNNYQSPEASGELTSFTNFYESTDRAFTNYRTPEASGELTDFEPSGYIVITSTDVVVTPTDTFELIDDVDYSITYPIEDTLELLDEAETQVRAYVEDTFELDDSEFEFIITAVPEDTIELEESAVTLPILIEDTFELDDSDFAIEITVEAEDTIELTESVSVSFDSHLSHGLELQFATRNHLSHGLEVMMLHSSPPPINVLTDPLNPASPSIIIDGDEIVNNEGLTPDPANNFINSSAGVNLFGSCDVFDYQINLSLSGENTFRAISKTSLGSAGTPISVAGLLGTITEDGHKSSHSARGFHISGVFGPSELLEQELLLVMDSFAPNVRALFPQYPLASPPSNVWTSVRDAAGAIASAAGITLTWLTVDAPLTDAFAETGLKVGDALRQLASRVGGVLTWDGSTGYVVIDPVQGFGGWGGVASCHFVDPGGAEDGNIRFNRNTVAYIPIQPLSVSDERPIPSTLIVPKAKPVYPFFHDRNKPKTEMYIPVRQEVDFTSPDNPIRIQILTPPEDVGPAFTTNNPDEWFDFPVAKIIAKDKSKKILVTPSDIPDTLKNGKFSLSIGYVRNLEPQTDAANQVVREEQERRRLRETIANERLRNSRKRYGNVNFVFHGSIPFGGNKTTIAFDNCNVTGIVENFSLAYSNGQNNCSMTVGEYGRMNQTYPRTMLNNSLANGP